MRPVGVVVLLAATVASAPGCLASLRGGSPEPAPAPDFALTTIDGEPVNLTHYRGRVLLVDVMGSWCAPCRVGTPHLRALAVRHPDDLAILSVAVQDEAADLEAFRDEFQARWDFALDTDGMFRKYGAVGVPTLVVVDPGGMIVARRAQDVLTVDQLEALVAPHLPRGSG